MTTRNGNRRIIVGVDGSPQSLAALEWAGREAQRAGGELDAVLVYGSGLAWIDVGSDAQPLIVTHSAEEAKEALHDALAGAHLPPENDVRVNPLVVLGDPAWALSDLARSAELLVVGSRGRGGFTGLLLGSVSQRCAERSECPVVVVPLGDAPPTDLAEERRVVVGVDGSTSSRRAVEWALADARPGDAVDAVLAYDGQIWWAVTDASVAASIETAAATSAAERLDRALEGIDVPEEVRLTRHIVPGDPWRVLVDRADHADLLVVGSRGRGGFTGLLLGSVSHRCAERCARPVVVVPARRAGAGEEADGERDES